MAVSDSNAIDESDKSYLQPLWDLRLGYEEYVTSPVFLIVVIVSFYFLAVLPWTLLDLFCSHWQWLKRYKIQPDKVFFILVCILFGTIHR